MTGGKPPYNSWGGPLWFFTFLLLALAGSLGPGPYAPSWASGRLYSSGSDTVSPEGKGGLEGEWGASWDSLALNVLEAFPHRAPPGS